MSEELKIEDFWALLDEGKYRKCHELLDNPNSNLDMAEKSTMRVAVYFRELRYKEAYDFAFDSKNECSNSIKGFAAFKHPRDMGKKKNEEIIKNAVKYLEMAISNKEVFVYSELIAQIMLIDSYFLLGKPEKSFFLARKIVDEYSASGNVGAILKDKCQVYLIDAFNPNNTLAEKREKLIQFFNISRLQRFKAFEDIVKYSIFLKFKPDDLIEAFISSDFS